MLQIVFIDNENYLKHYFIMNEVSWKSRWNKDQIRLFGISRGDAIYGGVPIKQTCDSLRYQGRAVGTKLYCEECRNSGVWLF
jgi:hypothetical protein